MFNEKKEGRGEVCECVGVCGKGVGGRRSGDWRGSWDCYTEILGSHPGAGLPFPSGRLVSPSLIHQQRIPAPFLVQDTACTPRTGTQQVNSFPLQREHAWSSLLTTQVCVSCVWHSKFEIWICCKIEAQVLSLSLSPGSLSNVGQIKHVSICLPCQGQQLKNIPEWTECCFLSRSIFP